MGRKRTVLIRLTRPHFACYLGYLEGLDIGSFPHRDLETTAESADAASDLRLAHSAIKWVPDQLLVAARRATGPSAARLITLPPDKLTVQYSKPVPTLEAFREERDPYEMYGEADLIAFFEEEYGNGSKRAGRQAARNARLRMKQLAALWQLEELVTTDPKLSDGVDGWLDPAIAQRLKNAYLLTLQHLVEAIIGFGYRWYTKVPRVGEKAAAQIVKWLIEPGVSAALGITLQARGLRRKRDLPTNLPAAYAPRTDTIPLENLFIPKELMGRQIPFAVRDRCCPPTMIWRQFKLG